MQCLYPHLLYCYCHERDYAPASHGDISSRIIFMELFGESEWDDKLVNRYERTNFIKPVIELRTLQRCSQNCRANNVNVAAATLFVSPPISIISRRIPR